MSEIETNTEHDVDEPEASAAAVEYNPTETTDRPRRNPKPNPRYDDNEKEARGKLKRRNTEVKAFKKIFAEILRAKDENNIEDVANLNEALKAKLKIVAEVNSDYLKSKVSNEIKSQCVSEMDAMTGFQQEVEDWLKRNVDENDADENDADENDESEDEDVDLEDVKAALLSFKASNKKLVKKQTKAFSDIATALKESLMAPKPEIPKFDGNPRTYNRFWSSFDAATKAITDSQIKLNFLIQNCVGEAREAIEDYVILDPSEGLQKARSTLEKRYGRPHVIARSYIDGLVKGSQIKPTDTDGISRLSLEMTKCQTTLKAMGYEADLNNSDGLLKIVRRLPHHMRAKWAERADIILEGGDEPNFAHLATFIERQARIATNMYGQDITAPKEDRKPHPKTTNRGHAYSTASATSVPERPISVAKCGFCREDHPMWRCDKFSSLPYAEKRNATRRQGLCDNCYNRGHVSKECPRRKFCSIQGCTLRYKHSTLLHPPNPTTQVAQYSGSAVQAPVTQSYATPSGSTYSSTSGAAVCLKVVPVRIIRNEQSFETYALLDNCSDITVCSSNLIDRLGIRRATREKIQITTVNGKKESKDAAKTSLRIEAVNGGQGIQLENVWAIDELNIPTDSVARQSDIDRIPHLRGINLPRTTADKVEILIGSDHPAVFWTLEERRGGHNDPVAVKTILGWTAIGPVGRRKAEGSFSNNFIQMALEDSVERLWKTDFNDVPSLKSSMSAEDHHALAIMSATTRKIGDHYQVGLPWRHSPPNLQNNRNMALTRLNSLKRQFDKNDNLKRRYTNEMQQYIEHGYAEEVKHPSQTTTEWYLPHHAVTHPRKPDKVRIVFDCSASSHGTSLNQELLQGPDLMNDLAGVLLRFRQHPIALSADIEAMFHQVNVKPDDTDALRFLWWTNGDTSRAPTDFKMLVHLFGATSSPSVCCFILRKTAEDNAHLFDTDTIDTVLRNFYMDDCLKSVETVSGAIKLQEELRCLLKRGGFRLTKWMSSNKDVLAMIPESERAPSVKRLTIDELPTERTLGVEWNIEDDAFQFTPQIKEKKPTKRGILSSISSLYDPLGFVAPIILSAKLILQELCRKRVGWDDVIDESAAQRWHEWLHNLPSLSSVSVPRCYHPIDFRVVSIQLHHFSDASELGYGAVSYLRYKDDRNQIHCSFVVGKSRLAPLKTISIPRLELSAAVVAVRLNTMLREQLTIPINETFYWTDSMAVLQYIRNTNRRFKTFVGNRLAAIHEASEVPQWRYVNTKQNPADLASRGLFPTDSDKLKFWHTGPEFLWRNDAHWPSQPASFPPIDTDDEVKAEYHTFLAQKAERSSIIHELITKYSSWYSLQKAIAWLLRFKKYCLNKYANNKPAPDTCALSVQELKTAAEEVVKIVQSEVYSKDLQSLASKSERKGTGSLTKLRPILVDGILRVGGRLENATIPEVQKHPIILPGNHHVTDMIIRQHHAALGHSGIDMVLSSVRKQFWVTSGKYAVKRIIDKCFKCRKRSAPFGKQFMAPLPSARVTPDKPPFSATGVDYFGPIYVKQGRSQVKRYGCLFTCLASRAVHIEVAHSLTTDSFLAALQRFICRRGAPDIIYSDNGTNFSSANKELKKSLNDLEQSKLYDHLRLKGIEWRFNPPAASHMGGVWERMIRTTRRILQMLLGEQTVNDECLLTLMTEVEKIINDRPLTTPSSHSADLHPLTPNDLLLLRPNASIPTGVYDKLANYSRRWYHQAQYLADVFWKRWVHEYLPALQQRHKWQHIERNFRTNDIVLVSDETVPRGKWPLARIVETYPDKNGLVRSVKVQTATTTKVRPIDKLCLLEAAV